MGRSRRQDAAHKAESNIQLRVNERGRTLWQVVDDERVVIADKEPLEVRPQLEDPEGCEFERNRLISKLDIGEKKQPRLLVDEQATPVR